MTHNFIVRILIIAVIMIFSGVCMSSCSEMHMKIDDVNVHVQWENNESVNALKASLPLSVNMHMYGGFEQVGSLGHNLTRNDKRMTTSAGDIVLYSGNQIVIFYGSNTWEYTKLGRITGKSESELKDLLGKSNVTLTLSGGID